MNYKINQFGSGYFHEIMGSGSEKSCNILAILDPGSSTHILLQTNKNILLRNQDNRHMLHITLLNILICLNVPSNIKRIILDGNGNIKPEINEAVKQFYNSTFRRSDVKLIDDTIGDTYVIKGEWLAKILKVNNPSQHNIISQFRMLFYNYLRDIYAKHNYIIDRVVLPNYTVSRIVSGPGVTTPIEIYAVPSYYYGVGTWVPHISLCSIPHIETLNKKLYDTFSDQAVKLASNPALHAGLTVAKKKINVRGIKYNMFEESGLMLGSQAGLIYGDVNIDMNRDILSVEFK